MCVVIYIFFIVASHQSHDSDNSVSVSVDNTMVDKCRPKINQVLEDSVNTKVGLIKAVQQQAVLWENRLGLNGFKHNEVKSVFWSIVGEELVENSVAHNSRNMIEMK